MAVPQPFDAGERPPRHDVPRHGRSGFVLVDGRQVHYLEWGHAGRPGVVCLHGGGQTAYMFEDLGAALAPRYHVLAYDFPDHGDSDALEGGDLDRKVLAATAPPLCAEFGIDAAVFVGGSTGGVASMTLAAGQPELVAGLVVIDVGHKVEAEGVLRIAAFMAEHESFATLEEAAEAIAAYLPNRTVQAPRLTRNLRQRGDGRWVWKHGLGRMIRDRGGLHLAQEGAMNMFVGLADDLQRLRCPTLILRGAASDVLSEEGATEIVGLIPGARFARVAGAGHLAAGDNPESFVNLVRGFLGEIGW